MRTSCKHSVSISCKYLVKSVARKCETVFVHRDYNCALYYVNTHDVASTRGLTPPPARVRVRGVKDVPGN
jgi:hypothetical protein